jgi:hypothetical protein
MGWALAHTEERSVQRFWWRDLRERDHLEDLDLERRITLKQIYKKWINGVYWLDLVENRDIWRFFFVKSIMNFCLENFGAIF